MRLQIRMTLCSIATALLLVTGISTTAIAGHRQVDWGPNAAVLRVDGAQVPGGCPIESPAGRFLFTARTGLDIWVNERSGPGGAFEAGNPLPAPINDPEANDFCPTPLPDSVLYFVSNRDGGCGSSDIYRAVHNPATGWSEPENLGCHPDGPNTVGLELSPAVIETIWGTFLFYSTDLGTEDQNIYVTYRQADGGFGPGDKLGWPINTPYDDRQPNVSQDGRVIVFASDRPSSAHDESGFDIFTAERRFAFQRWRRVTNLSESVPFSTVADGETRPSLSWDGERLYYGSGGVWVSERNDYRRFFRGR